LAVVGVVVFAWLVGLSGLRHTFSLTPPFRYQAVPKFASAAAIPYANILLLLQPRAALLL
jgi:hypothetical protein